MAANKKYFTGSDQRAVRTVYANISKAAIFDALLDVAAADSGLADEDGEALFSALRERLVPVLERRGDKVPEEFRAQPAKLSKGGE